MKIKSLSTTGFAKFNKEEAWSDFEDGINVFYGKNEAGKTTIFKMIVALLYGKAKRKKGQNLINDETQQLNVAGRVYLQDREVEIYRNLLKDEGSVVGPLAGVDHIPRRTYEDVYALTLDGLTQMNTETWASIQDLLLSQYSSDTFRTPKRVLEIIDKDARVIKKPTERGNSLLKDLADKRHQAFIRKKEAEEALQKAEDLKVKLDQIQVEIDLMKQKKEDLLERRNKVKSFLPIYTLRKDQASIKKNLLDLDQLEDLSLERYQEKKAALKNLYIKMDECSDKVSKFVLEKRRLLAFLDQEDLSELTFNEMFQKNVMISEWALDLVEKDKECRLLEDQFKQVYDQTFDDTYKEGQMDKVQKLNHLNLKSLIQEIESINEEIKIIKRQKRVQGSERSNTIIFMSILMILASGAGFYYYSNSWIAYLSLVVMGSSLMQVLFQLAKRHGKHKSAEALKEDRDGIKKRLRHEMTGFRLSSIVEEFMGSDFLGQITELKHLAERYQGIHEAYQSKKNHYDLQKAQVESYIKKHIGVWDENTNPFDLLGQKIEDQKSQKNRVDVINGQLDLLNDNLRQVEADLNAVETWVFTADGLLRNLGQGDLEEGLSQLKDQESLRTQLRIINDKLGTISYDREAYKAFEVLLETSEDKSLYDGNHIEVELSVVDEGLTERIIHLNSLKKDWVSMVSSTDFSQAKGSLLAIDQEILMLKRRYDRYTIMAHLVKAADDSFRQKNQPQVFKRAGDYLSLMTEGKYTRLQVIEPEEGKADFLITVEGPKGVLEVNEKFSKGTLNQIYLSLRLSLIDHLDQAGQGLPICFDEILIEWDQDRLKETIKLIKSVAKKRQVFIFTCHKWFVDALNHDGPIKVYYL